MFGKTRLCGLAELHDCEEEKGQCGLKKSREVSSTRWIGEDLSIWRELWKGGSVQEIGEPGKMEGVLHRCISLPPHVTVLTDGHRCQ